MSLHGPLAVTIGVPNVHETAAYYAGFGLTRGRAAGSAPPAGNFSEYYSDMDCIIDDHLWTPRNWRGRGGCSPGARRPPSFLHPEDLAAMMTGAHSAR
jgi:hypothetical protein